MAIIGNSGSGKSTFLNMIGGLDRPSAGKLYVDGKNLFQMTENDWLNIREVPLVLCGEQCEKSSSLFDCVGKCNDTDAFCGRKRKGSF